jgi:hypothetical protein
MASQYLLLLLTPTLARPTPSAWAFNKTPA